MPSPTPLRACDKLDLLLKSEQTDVSTLSAEETAAMMVQLTEMFRCSVTHDCKKRVEHSDRALVVFKQLSTHLKALRGEEI